MSERDATSPWQESRTVVLLVLTYGLWVLATMAPTGPWLTPAIVLVALCGAMHSSLSHEVLHGHPSANALVNAALVFPALLLVIPYLRFRDTHLAHHRDESLTDPYDDPESNFHDPMVWATLPAPLRWLLGLNNTLLGRMVLGPMIGQLAFMRDDWRAIRAGDLAVVWGWLWHLPAMLMVLVWLAWVPMPFWAYFIGVYLGLSLLKIRTFLEHRAHERARGRSVVIEDRGPLALLFLNNNLHVVHHMHPNAPWYRLPMLYARNRDHYLRRNEGYRYRSYAQVLRLYLLHAKDPVPHPLMRR